MHLLHAYMSLDLRCKLQFLMKLTNLPERSDVIDTRLYRFKQSTKADSTAISVLSTESHDLDLPC